MLLYIRFVCKDTVEEKILALQKRKTALATNVLTGYDAVFFCELLPMWGLLM